jgi:glutathione synthase/RimK-type ligase-like ATP-grasp enzyme
MTKALILFTKLSVETGAAQPTELQRLLTAGTADLQVDVATYDELLFSMSNDGAIIRIAERDITLADYDIVYTRRINENSSEAMAVGKYCLSEGVPAIDEETANRPGSMTKLTQYMQFAIAGISIPKTLYSPNAAVLLSALERGELSFPLILKSITGSRGEDNYLVESLDTAKKLFAEYPTVHFLAQQYVANTADYRIWVCGDQIGPILHRSRQTGHKNNTSQGGEATLLEDRSGIPQLVLDESIRAAQLLQRDVAGADVIFENDDLAAPFYFLEINRAPQIESTPFADIKARALGEYLRRKARPRKPKGAK